MERTIYPKRIPDAINARPHMEFTCVRNDLLRDPRISFKAKGMLALLLSNQPGKWISYLKTLQKFGKEGPDAINNGIKELERFGYLIRVHYVDKETKRRRGSFWAYTDVAGEFEMDEQLDLLKENSMEIQGKNPALKIIGNNAGADGNETGDNMERPDMENRHMENPQLKILNNNNTKKNKNISLRKEKPEMVKDKNSVNVPVQKKPSIKERTQQLIPLAIKLADIVRSNKNIKINQTKITSWASEIRKIVEVDGISPPRIQKALDWYADHIGGQYIPIIESGASLRSKFLRLEDAMERTGALVNQGSPNNAGVKGSSNSPQKIFKKHFPNDTLRKAFVDSCYKSAREIFPSGKRDELTLLAETIVKFHSQIVTIQDTHFTDDLRRALPDYSPMNIIQAYIRWIEDNKHWITGRKLSMFSVEHGLFRDFRRRWAFEIDHMARDPLTGSADW